MFLEFLMEIKKKMGMLPSVHCHSHLRITSSSQNHDEYFLVDASKSLIFIDEKNSLKVNNIRTINYVIFFTVI